MWRQKAYYPSYEFSSPAGREMQRVKIGEKIIIFSLLPITNDCFAPLFQGRSIREDSLYYNGLALPDLLSIWILSYNIKMDDEEEVLS